MRLVVAVTCYVFGGGDAATEPSLRVDGEEVKWLDALCLFVSWGPFLRCRANIPAGGALG